MSEDKPQRRTAAVVHREWIENIEQRARALERQHATFSQQDDCIVARLGELQDLLTSDMATGEDSDD
jgi:chaperonin cofactor prefoldin